MNRLSQHILSVLRLYDSVGLPGIGVYKISYIGASIDRENFCFLPPHYKVDFTPEEDNADGRLLESYQRKERISRRDARALLKADLEEFKAYLREGGNPITRELNSFCHYLPVLKLRHEEVEPQPEVEANFMEANPKPELFEEESQRLNEEFLPPVEEGKPHRGFQRNPEYYYLPIHKRLAKLAACFLLVVIVGIAAIMPIQPYGKSASTASILPIGMQEKNDVESDAQGETTVTEELKGEKPSPASERQAKAESAEEPIPGALSLETSPRTSTGKEETNKYYAIVAAFKSQKETEKFINSQKGDLSRFDTIKNGSFYLISAASSNDREDLQKNMPLIRADYPDSWIYTLK